MTAAVPDPADPQADLDAKIYEAIRRTRDGSWTADMATRNVLAVVEPLLRQAREALTTTQQDALNEAADDFEVPGNGVYVSAYEQQTFAIVRQDLVEQLRARASAIGNQP